MKEYLLYDDGERDPCMYVREKRKNSMEIEYLVRDLPKRGLESKVCNDEDEPNIFEKNLPYALPCLVPALAADYVGILGDAGIDAPTLTAMATLGCMGGLFKNYGAAAMMALPTWITLMFGEALHNYDVTKDPTAFKWEEYYEPSILAFAGSMVVAGVAGYLWNMFGKSKKEEYSENLERYF